MRKSKCLRAFAEVTTLKPEIGFSCQGQRLAACVHKRAPWAPVRVCRVVSTGFSGLSLVVWGQLVCGAVLAIQGQPESHKSNAKLNDFLSCISEYCICDSWGVLIWSFFFFFFWQNEKLAASVSFQPFFVSVLVHVTRTPQK